MMMRIAPVLATAAVLAAGVLAFFLSLGLTRLAIALTARVSYRVISFVTLATLGYGDISPASPIAQVIVILEAVTGTFYMAIVVASLIGAYFGRQPR